MKKLTLLLSVCALVFASCGNDDDASTDQDQLIGTWKFFMYTENGVEQTLDPCDTEETIVYSADGNATITDYVEDAGNNCVVDETFSATWANIGNGSYSLTAFGETQTAEITFEGNTHYFETVYDNETPNDTSDDIIERDVYIRQ